MGEIKEALSIIKARWIEVCFIIGLMAVLMPLFGLLLTVYSLKANWMTVANRGIMLLHICISLFVLLIGGGFLRTVYLEGKKRQSIFGLVKTGRHFFSRLLGFGILYAGAMMFPVMVFFLLTWSAVCEPNSSMINRIMAIALKLILVKPILLAPATIIVTDCELFGSFGFIRRMRLLDAKPMLAIFLIQLLLPLFFPHLSVESLWHYPRVTLYSILSYGLSLLMMIMAVRFVGSARGKQVESEQV